MCASVDKAHTECTSPSSGNVNLCALVSMACYMTKGLSIHGYICEPKFSNYFIAGHAVYPGAAMCVAALFSSGLPRGGGSYMSITNTRL